MEKTELMRQLEAEHGKDIREILLKAFNENGGSRYRMAEALNLHNRTIPNWYQHLGARVEKRLVFPKQD